MRSTSDRSRVHALLALCVYVLASIAILCHEREYAHAVCEHGESVHVELDAATLECSVDIGHADHDVPLHAAHPASETSSGPRFDAVDTQTSRGAHAHCSLTQANAPARAPEGRILGPAFVHEPLDAHPPLARVCVDSAPRYLLAPHHSPPRA